MHYLNCNCPKCQLSGNQEWVFPNNIRSYGEIGWESPFSEIEEMDLAAKLLSISSKEEITPVVLSEPETKESTVMLDRCAAPYNRCLAPFQNPAVVDWASVRQQRLTNCPLPAILAALGRACPKFLRAMIYHDLTQPYESTLGKRPGAGPSVFQVKFKGAKRKIIISPRLHFPRPRDAQHPVAPELENLMFARASDGGWVSYIEKAYVVMRGKNCYENLNMNTMNPPLTVNRFFFDVLGRFTKVELDEGLIFYNLSPDDTDIEGCKTARPGNTRNVCPPLERIVSQNVCFLELTKKRLTALLDRAGGRPRCPARPTIATTHASSSRLIKRHTYIVTRLSRAGVHVQEFMRGSPPETIRLADLDREFDAIFQSSGDCT